MRGRVQGFTLIELMVAISIMALMTMMSWKGLDSISRTQHSLSQNADDVLALQATLTQWGTDLDELVSQPDMPGLDWDGRTIRMVRRSSDVNAQGLMVVAWARRSMGASAGQWLRWQSPVLSNRGDLDRAWQKAALWAQTPSEEDRLREVRTLPIDQWQVFYYRNNAWTNPLSSADRVTDSKNDEATIAAVPDGVRLILTLSAGQAVSGTLVRDWVSPLVVGRQ